MPSDGKQYVRIAKIETSTHTVTCEDSAAMLPLCNALSHSKYWQILDVPRIGSVWEMMHGKLRIAAINGTSPDEIEILYDDLFYHASYEERPPIKFSLWCELRQAGLLLAAD